MAALGAAEGPGAVLVHALRPAGVLCGRIVRQLHFPVCPRRVCGQRFRRKGGGRCVARQRGGGGHPAIRAWPQDLRQQHPPANDCRDALFHPRAGRVYAFRREPALLGDCGGDFHPG